MDFADPEVHRVKIKIKSEESDKYLDLSREIKRLWNMKLTMIPILMGVFETIPKSLVKGLDDLEINGQVKTIQITTLRSARILRRVLETWGELLSLKFQWKIIS